MYLASSIHRRLTNRRRGADLACQDLKNQIKANIDYLEDMTVVLPVEGKWIATTMIILSLPIFIAQSSGAVRY